MPGGGGRITDVPGPHVEWEGQVAQVWTAAEDGSNAVAYAGAGPALARRLEEWGFSGLARAVKKRRGTVGYISGLEVALESRGKGVGTAFVAAMVDALAGLGASAVYAHLAPERGRIADLFRFYERLGFEESHCCPEDMWPVVRLDVGKRPRS